MTCQVTPQLPINVLVLGVAVSLAAYAVTQYYRRGHRSELAAFVSLMVAISLWEVGGIAEDVATSASAKLLAVNFINAIAVWLFVYSMLWLALAYSNNTKWVNRWTVGAALAHIAGTAAVLAVAPEFLYEVTGLTTRGPVTAMGVGFDQWVALDRRLKLAFYITQLYGYLVILTAGVVLGQYLVRNRGSLYTGQAGSLAVGIGIPLTANLLLFTGTIPPELSATDIALAATALGFAVAVFRYRFLRITPVGRQQLVDGMSDPVVMLDGRDRVVDCNPAARTLVDAPPDWRGMAATGFFEPLPGSVERITQGGDEGSITAGVDGSARTFSPDVSAIRGGGDAPVGRLLVFRDITEQKQREQQLRRQNERLDQFASLVSHDLRNPLHVADSNLALAAETGDRDRIETARENLDRMETIIEELLTMARAGLSVEDTDAVGIAAVVRESWHHAQTEGLTLDLQVSESTTVQADRDRLLHVFENLVRNAVDHNDPPLTVRIGTLDAASSSGAEQPVGFYVEDDGDGIPESHREDVFEYGFTTTSDGTGFGLSIVQDIVDAHGWNVCVTEGDDGGARFEIRY
ncbi:histidine kinase N-terminal 7TM domain-containing protein [Halapricum sp. CBA1109]|uniref:histidine kinase N-terminal 7TM domain-containing protein n=1 Tax=Halapricum sp. CBA1109 TaxID=2668068 RepID=UPI0018D2424D|nr:histidine kinase N-terminal 7TM domain-containing protein [Halapricum sp. CBA1109]